MTQVDVVIPAWGADPWLERSVDSVLDSTGVEATAVVVDNGADPATVERIAARAGVRVVRPMANLGFAGGCNAGAAASTGAIVAFLNQDAVLEPGALAALAGVAARPGVGIASASVRLADDRDLVNSAGNPVHFLGFSWAGAYGEPAVAHDAEREIASASGTAMAMRRDVWDALGGFVEEYFAYLEDAELSLRCWQRDLRVVYVPTAVVVHRYEFSRNPTKWYLLERNRMVMLLTTYERRTLLLLLPAIVGVEIGMLLVAARAGWLRPKLRGWAWVFRQRRWVGERRCRLQAARVVGDRALAPRLTTRFAAANMGVPAWIRPLDAGLAAYWRITRTILGPYEPLA
ncbi:MAG TPA: glycosyltransferase [Acidimicrobiales bacterium]|nr:glycosyltransferase [Acidimicrobiales bacterium]